MQVSVREAEGRGWPSGLWWPQEGRELGVMASSGAAHGPTPYGRGLGSAGGWRKQKAYEVRGRS